jgi:hypothetical protein
MTAKPQQETNFIWCPVCMVHTYHKKKKGNWICTDWNHEDFLRFRTDPWIEEYRKSQKANQVPVGKVG